MSILTLNKDAKKNCMYFFGYLRVRVHLGKNIGKKFIMNHTQEILRLLWRKNSSFLGAHNRTTNFIYISGFRWSMLFDIECSYASSTYSWVHHEKTLQTVEGVLSHHFHPAGVFSRCQNLLFDPPCPSKHAFPFILWSWRIWHIRIC